MNDDPIFLCSYLKRYMFNLRTTIILAALIFSSSFVTMDALAAPVPKSLLPKPTPCEICVEGRNACEGETRLSFAQCFVDRRNPTPGQIWCLLREFDGRMLNYDDEIDIDTTAYSIAECSSLYSDPDHPDAPLDISKDRYRTCSNETSTYYDACLRLNDCVEVCAREGKDPDGTLKSADASAPVDASTSMPVQ